MFTAPLGYLLLLLPVVFVLHVWHLHTRRKSALRVNTEFRSSRLSITWRLRWRWLVPAFRMLGLSALVIGIASPFDWDATEQLDVEGVAIELVVDRSGSMLADDYRVDNEYVSRLSAVRGAAERFVVGDGDDAGRRSDLIGLVTFAASAEVAAPLTLEHEMVVAELERTEAAADYREDGTAIGDAMALGAAELESIARSVAHQNGAEPLTKVLILLTDGQQNAGRLTPEEALGFAEHFDVRTYVIGLEPGSLESEAARNRIAAQRERLQQIASSTGGRFFTVDSSFDLQRVYAEIDALERAPTGKQRLVARRHWAVRWFALGPFGLPPIALIGFVALALESLMSWSVFAEVG